MSGPAGVGTAVGIADGADGSGMGGRRHAARATTPRQTAHIAAFIAGRLRSTVRFTSASSSAGLDRVGPAQLLFENDEEDVVLAQRQLALEVAIGTDGDGRLLARLPGGG